MDQDKKYSECGPYKIIKTLGQGAFAKVKLSERGGMSYAIKMFKVQSCQQQLIEKITNEVKTLEAIRHPNLIQMIQFLPSIVYKKHNGDESDKVCLVLEYAAGGELYEFIAQTGQFREDICRFYFKQLLQSLKYLHGMGIIHGDLKPENVLFDSNFNLKLADFGSASQIGKNGTGVPTTHVGTRGYMAPEILANQDFNGPSVDLFAAAIILFIMQTGVPPFKEASLKDQAYRMICANKFEEFWALKCKILKNIDFFSQDFKFLVSTMLAYDPVQRLSMSEIERQPWLQGPTSTLEQISCEFNIRKNKVDSQLVAAKLKKQAEKSNQPIKQGSVFCGIGKFRSLDDLIKVYPQVEQKLNDTKRSLKLYQAKWGKHNDFLSSLDPDFLLRFLLSNYERYCNEVLFVSSDRFKFSVRQVDENNEALSFTIEFYRYDEEMIFVDFIKQEGSTLDFYKKVMQMQDIINSQ